MKEQDIQQKLANLSPEKRELLLKELRKRKSSTQPKTIDAIKPTARNRDLFALSFSQQRLWFLDQLEGQNPTYNMPAVLELTGQLNLGAFEKSLNQIVERHETLRTEFITREGKGYQRVLPSLEYKIETISLLDEENPQQKKRQLITRSANQNFDLTCAPLFRCRLIQMSEREWTFIICLHHIISDGWSSSIIISELSNYYRGNVEGSALLPPTLEIQYADYAVWQREKLSGEYLEKQLKFWKAELEGLEPLEFPTDYRRPAVLTNNGARQFFSISPELGSAVDQLSRQLKCTPFNIFLALFNVLIYRYSGQHDFGVGTPVANRTQSSIEILIGFFINSLTLRSKIDPQQSFESLVTQLQKTSQRAIDHQEVPFEKLLDELGVERNMSQSPLFQLMFVFQNTPKAEFDLSDLHASFSPVESSTAKFDLTLTINHGAEGYEGEWEYNTDLFRPETIDQLIRHYLNLAQQLVVNPATAINEVCFLDPQEQDRLLLQWNQSEQPERVSNKPTDCIHGKVEAKAIEHGAQTALVYEQQTLSYEALNKKANQLAHFLMAKGLQKNDFVGLCLDRGMDMVVSILGVLKAGGAYIPLDPSSPKERVQFIIEDAGIQWMLVDSDQRLADYESIQAFALQSESHSIESLSDSNPQVNVDPTDIAYIIYTSGTTGRPKGVLIPHQNVIRLFDATDSWCQFNDQDVWTLFHSYAFDFSVWEIWGALFHGGQLVIVPQWIARSPADFYQLLISQKVTVLNQTPSAFSQLVYVDQEQGFCDDFNLRFVIFGGEALDYNSLRKWVGRYGLDQPAMINMYGITETTVHVTYHPISQQDLVTGASNIGKPIADLNVYLLDAYQNPVPAGVKGEMYVGGAGVATGYLNRSTLDDEKFITLQLPGLREQRVYRSGDLARYLANGDIEYLGRIDNQVKVRGFRIELGEIETSLNELVCVKESVVLVEENEKAQKNIVAYLIPRKDSDESGVDLNFDIAEVRQALKDRLADYMVPSFFVTVEEFPLTANGKVDHKALHAHRLVDGSQSSVVKKAYVAPQTENEIKLAEIWQAVLNLDLVGINDNFFELGGDSILTIQIVSRAKRSGINITAKQIFENQSIAELSRVTQQVRNIIAEQGRVEGPITLTPIQHWFFEQELVEPNYWHQSVLVEVDERVNEDLLEKACASLVEQHDGLNICFRGTQQSVVGEQNVAFDKPVIQRYQLVDDEALTSVTESIQKQCDIEKGPMVLFALLEKELPENKVERFLFVAAHHLVVDGVSWRILLDDLNEALSQLEDGSVIQLGQKTTSFQQFGEIFKQRVSEGLFADQLAYWQSVSANVLFELPVDDLQGSNAFSDAASHEVLFDSDTTEALLRTAHQAYGTETEELLLACLTRALSRWADNDRVSVNLEHHGRELPIDEIDLTRTVGWFTSIYPQSFNNYEGDWQQQILAHKEIIRTIPDHGLGYGALRYWSDKSELNDSVKDAPVLFNYLGQFSGQQQDSALFRLSEQKAASNFAGSNQRRYELEVNGAVTQGALRFTVSYSQARINQSSIKAFADEFYKAVQECVQHCCAEGNFGYSPSDFPLINIPANQLNDCLRPAVSAHQKREIEAIYPLTSMQKGMLFHSLYENEIGLYHEQVLVPLTGDLQVGLLKQAWQETLDQYGILRTSFLWLDQDEPLQVVFKNRAVDFKVIPINQALNEELTLRYKKQDLEREFDLAGDVQLRLSLLQFENQQYQLLISFHHIILDGWSLGLVFSSAFSRYIAATQGQTIQMPSGPPFERFISHLEAKDKSEDEVFWNQYLTDFERPTELPRNISDGRSSKQRCRVIREIDDELFVRINQFGQRHHLTPNVLFQAAWSILLSRLSGQKQICYGVTVSGRPVEIDRIENTAGLFINTLPMFVEVGQHELMPWLQEFQQAQLAVIKHELTPLADIQRYCNLKKQNLFECLFVFENFPIDDALKEGLPGIEVGALDSHWHTNFPITMVLNPGQTLSVSVSYDSGLYREKYIQQLFDYYELILLQIVDSERKENSLRLDQICLVDEAEKKKIVGDWNNTAREYPKEKTIAQLFEAVVDKTPDAIALTFNGDHLSYQCLNQKANQYAHFLMAEGVCQNEVVAICADRNIELIVSIIAVLKIGAAFVPLVSDYPAQRLSYMVKDAGAKRLLLPRSSRAKFEFIDAQLIDFEPDCEHCSIENPLVSEVDSETLGPIFYTSGSTGNPKGIFVPQRGITRLVMNNHFIPLNSDTVFIQIASVPFDACSLEIWGSLLNGGRLVIAPTGVIEAGGLGDLIRAEKVNSIFITTALFHYQAEFSLQSFAGLKYLITGGDVLSVSAAKTVLEAYPGLQLTNAYGPTENCTFTTCHLMNSVAEVGQPVPVGKPIANTQVYILDDQLNPVAVGTPGQLCTAGDGVACGYLNQDQLTAEVFVENPFAELYGHGKVLYKTGDMARFLDDGSIEFVGRIDQQVKIRGFRIELSEIEALLDGHAQIRQSAVMAHSDDKGVKRLVAYLVVDEAQPNLEANSVREYVGLHLPDYMVPASFIFLSRLPVTSNGKLDRKALPEPSFENISLTKVAPRNNTETSLCDIWEQVLGVESVGIDDNYFELGGDSILSIQVLSRAKRVGILITAKQIFELQTIAKLAQAAKKGVQVSAEQGLVTQEALITPIQQWYFDLPLVAPQHWNMSLLLKVISPVATAELECSLRATVKAMVEQHDYLRSHFSHSNQQTLDQNNSKHGWKHSYLPLNYFTDASSNVFESLDYSDSEESSDTIIATIGQQVQSSFDLASGTLFKIVLLKLSANEYRLFWVVHHLLIDGVSWRILLEDMQIGLTQALGGEAINLGDKSTSFSQWSVAQHEFAQSDAVHQQLSYWQNLWGGLDASEVARLPLKSNDSHRIKDSNEFKFELSEQHTQQLLLEANKAYKTEINDLLLAALTSALSEQCQHSRCLLHMEGHGREWVSDAVDVSRTVGWFTSLYPVLLSLPKGASVGDEIKAVKQQLRQIPDKGFGYGLIKHLKSDGDFGASLEALENSQISFNYLGQTDNSFSEGEFFQLASESPGSERDENEIQPYALDVFAIVIQGKMQFGFRFSGDNLGVKFVETLAQQFEARLLEILTHCLDPQHFGFVPADFNSTPLSQNQIDDLCQRYPTLDDVYALSPLQHGMMFHALLDEDSAVYFEQHCFNIKGSLNPEKLMDAWHQVIQRHDILRSLYLPEGADHSALQLVLNKVSLPFSQLNLSQQESEQYLLEDRKKGFQFDQAPLMRVALIDHGNGLQKLVWSFHHILLDGWSVSLVVGEVFQLYELSLQNEKVVLAEAGKYKNYITWLAEQPKQLAADYWQQNLAGFTHPTVLGMKSSHRLNNMNSVDNPIYDFLLDSELQAQLEQFGKHNRITLNTVFQSAWALLLGHYSNETDVVFGTTVSGRPADITDVEQMVGLFINTLPLRMSLEQDAPVLEWLQSVQDGQLQSREFEYMPLFEINRLSEVEGDQRLFDSLLVFENYPVSEALKTDQISVEVDAVESVEQTNFPLTIIVMPGEKIAVRFSYDDRWFNQTIMARLGRQLNQVIRQLIGDSQSVGQISLLDDEDRSQLLDGWCTSPLSHNHSGSTVTEAIIESVRSNPSAIAVRDDAVEISYGELLETADYFCADLVSKGFKSEDLVAVCLNRQASMVPVLFAVHLAGGAYVPIDSSSPEQRIETMLRDACPKVCVTERRMQDSLEPLLESLGIQMIVLEDVLEASQLSAGSENDGSKNLAFKGRSMKGLSSKEQSLKEQGFENYVPPVTLPKPNDLAYVIYTSGSTGKPKGVLIEHQGLKNLSEWSAQNFALDANAVCTQMAGFGFDACVWEIWPCLMAGATLNVVSDEQRLDLAALASMMASQRVSHSFMPTPLAEAFIKLDLSKLVLKVLLTGGDQLTQWPDKALPFAVYNQYGPTESSVVATSGEVKPVSEGEEQGLPSIGSVIANTKLYVLDEDLQPVGVGVPGELHIGGVGLARGYLNQPQLTQQQFIRCDHLSGESVRLYKSGDLVRFNDQGELEFLGRIDQQVKVRGFRIELGEIEAQIALVEGVEECVVQAWDNEQGAKYLVAYIVPQSVSRSVSRSEQGAEVCFDNLVEQVRQNLNAKLPSYMMPAAFTSLGVLPLTENGKVNRKVLPQIELADQLDNDYVPPSNDIEHQLVEIWQQVLELDKVGVQDDFFALGGHSILATKAHARMREQMSIELPLKVLFEVTRIAELAELISSVNGSLEDDATELEDDDFEEGSL